MMDAAPGFAGQGCVWFSRSGRPLDPDEHARFRLIVGSFTGAAVCEIAVVTGPELAQLLRAEESDNRWWDAEEDERSRLWEIAAERMTEGGLLDALSVAVNPVSATVRHAATRLAAAGVATDSGIVERAADAAALSLHQCALATLAGAPDGHYFRAKYECFAAGRWPLGVRAGKYYVV